MTPNWANQTIWTGDNLPILRGMNSASVDLIYLDPPFNSKANYAAPIGSKAAGAAFKDTWTLSDVDAEWINLIEAKHGALYRVLLAAMTSSDKSYLAYMAARLLEMRRLLKPTGSIYLHCDPTMSHYLKLVMDAIFGRRSFRSEIVWRRVNPTGRGAKRLANNADRLLLYVNGEHFTWNQQHVPHKHEYIKKFYRHNDKTGRLYRLDNLKGAGTRTGPSGQPWRGIDPTDTGSHWAVPNSVLSDEQRSLPTQEKLEILDSMGRIHWPSRGRIPAYRRYLDEMPGTPIDTLWDDIGPIQAHAKERVGYPTQKPLALLERIIESSCNSDDAVLDPFCGCATACIAAEGLKRRWVGIDISQKAAELVRQRMTAELGMFYQGAHRTDVPLRTDLGKLPRYNSPKNRTQLYGEQGGDCAGCSTHFEARHFDVDHIIAKAKGGTDHIENLQLLCGSCNSIKGDRGMDYLKAKLAL